MELPPPPSSHSNFPFSLQMHDPIFFLFFAFFSLSLSFFLSLSLYKRFSKHQQNRHKPQTAAENRHKDEMARPENSDPARSVLMDAALPSDSDDPDSSPRGKKKKRKAKKKRVNSGAEEKNGGGGTGESADPGSDSGVRFETACLYPFTSSSSAMQRKIKQQYDELVRSNDSKKLTLAQVVQFANSLVDARDELQHKADAIQRKFIITKALLCKANRSSFDRLHQQIYKLELEQKRLEDDAFVYNSLQQQLKLSPAYQKMLELGACMEKEKSCGLGDNIDDEFAEISFEELLAQEKKDSFWQKNGKSRLCSS